MAIAILSLPPVHLLPHKLTPLLKPQTGPIYGVSWELSVSPPVPPGSCKLEPPLLVPMTEPLLSVMGKSSFPTEENTQFFPSVSLPCECLLLLPQNTHFWSPYIWGASLVAGSYNFTQF